MKKDHRLGITARVWSPYLKSRLGFSAKSKRSLFSLLCLALKKDGFPKPGDVVERTWARQHVDHIVAEFEKLRGTTVYVRPADVRPMQKTKQQTKPSPTTDDFLSSYEWRKVRMVALKKFGARCQCCGASPENGVMIHVDHIKPRRLFPHLALDVDNLQVLCEVCNHGKGNWDQTDWRPEETDSNVVSILRDIAKNG